MTPTRMTEPPLSYQSSADAAHPTTSPSLPPEVVGCLRNARFLHLATCTALRPHVALMNYTYLPSTPFSAAPVPTIIMTTNPSSRKTLNLASNPNVSLLVHDWVSHRPAPSSSSSSSEHQHDRPRDGSPPAAAAAGGSGLAALLLGLNTAALGRISATINGTARILEPGSDEDAWCRDRHVENHRFGTRRRGSTSVGGGGSGGGGAAAGTGTNASTSVGGTDPELEGGCFLAGEDVRVVLVTISDGRIADWKGGVKDFVVESPDDRPDSDGRLRPNGV